MNIIPSSSSSSLPNSTSNHPATSPLVPPNSIMLPHHNSHHHHIQSPHHSHHSLVPSPHTPLHSHPNMHPRMGLSPISPGQYPTSPMMSWPQPYRNGGVRTPCQPPPPYSPAGSASSSYLNKNLNSEASNVSLIRSSEVNSLVVNILLSDSLLNIFRDHNFDSCTLCVCNAGGKVVGNIKGNDAGAYLPQVLLPTMSPYPPYPPYSPAPSHHFVEEDSVRCNCGFSAVVNRRLSHMAGLFIEDEAEITGILEEPTEKDDLNGAVLNVIDLVREQCVMVHSSCNALYRAARQYKQRPTIPPINMLEFRDANEVVSLALEQGRLAQLEAATVSMCKVDFFIHL